MFIYMAAVHTNGYYHSKRYENLNERERHVIHTLPHWLESYHYINKQSYVDVIREKKTPIFLDSGAFSAYTLGFKINITDYCNYIKENFDIIRVDDGIVMASVLDGIGDPQETYENQMEMERQGIRPLPCFHAGEDERYLEWYVQNYDYITLGGMVGASTKQLMIWLDRVWDRYLTDPSGRPRIRVHGFGITSIPIMERYPWWSCDSSSWIQSASFGTVMVPRFGSIQISEKSPAKHEAGQHFESLKPMDKVKVEQAILDSYFDPQRLAQVYESRAAYNIWSFGEINRIINEVNPNRFKCEYQELF